MNKRAIIVALVGVNLLLLGGLILMAYDLPAAQAQVGRGGNYVAVSGEIEEGIDALYVLDLDDQTLKVVLVNKQGNQPELVGVRPGPDVVSDLRRPPAQEQRGRRSRR